MNAKRSLLGTALTLASLVGATALTACGSPATQTKSADGSVTLTSLPSAQVTVDGAVKGSTPLTLTLPSGNHKVVLKADGFADFSQTVAVGSGIGTSVDFSLAANDREDPRVIGLLAKDLGFEVPPAEEIPVSRGAAKQSIAVILWPVGDVRKAGLATFRLDVSDSYKDNGVLRFKQGRKTLYERAFSPEQLVTWEPIPAEVISGVSKGDKVTWGLFFDGPKSPKDITATFEVVDRPQVDSAMAKIDTNKAYQRQDALSRELLKGETLQNYRLYTEAMSKYVEILLSDPDSWLPFRGMVASLRRMGAEESSLYTELAQFVQGKGQAHSGGESGLGTIPNGLKMGNKPTLVTYNEGVARAAEKAKYGGDKVGPATVAPVAGPDGSPTAEGGAGDEAMQQLMMDARNAHMRLNAMQETANAAKTYLSQLKNALNAANEAKKNLQEVAGKLTAAQAALDAIQNAPVPDPVGDPAGYAAYQMALAQAQHAVSNLVTQLASAQAGAAEAIANAPNQSQIDQADQAAQEAQRAFDQMKHITAQLDEQVGQAGLAAVNPANENPGPGNGGPANAGGVGDGTQGPGVADGQHLTPEQLAINFAGAQERLATFQTRAAAAATGQANAEAAYEAALVGGDPVAIQAALNTLNQANQELGEANQKVQSAQALVTKILGQMSQGPH